MKPVQLLALLLAAGCARAPAQNIQAAAPAQSNQAAEQALQPDPVMRPEVTQEAVMDRIERTIRLPPGADPLTSYERSYAWQQRTDGQRKVVGVYLSPEGTNRGRRWVAEQDLPLIMDGGCGMIRLTYDVATQRIEEIACNGVA